MNFKKLEKDFKKSVLKRMKKAQEEITPEKKRKAWVDYIELNVPNKLIEEVPLPLFCQR